MRITSPAPRGALSVPVSVGVVSSVVVPLPKVPCTMPTLSTKPPMLAVCVGAVVSTLMTMALDGVPRLPAVSATTAV